MSTTTLDQILRAVEALSPDEQATLMTYLQERSRQGDLSVHDRMALLRGAQIQVKVNREPSIRRTDWYDDDGR